MATYYWRGSSGSFLLPAGWMLADASGAPSPASIAPGDGDTVIFDTAGMALAADAAFAGVVQLNLVAGALDLGGHTLSLLNTAQLGDSGSRITGPGTLETDAISAVPSAAVNGAAVLLAGGATWSNAGLVMDAGIVGLGVGAGDTATVINQPGALFALAIDQAGQIAAAPGATSSFVNHGTLAKTNGAGVSSLTVSVTNSGVITANSGTLELDGGGTLGGMIGGDAGRVRLAGTYALPSDSTSSVSFGTGAVLGAGANGMAVLSGPGTLVSSGSVQILGGGGTQVLLAAGATWDNAGTIGATADLGIDTTGGTLVNQAGALLAFSGDAGIVGSGAGSLVNGGTLTRSGVGASRLAVPVIDTGSILIAGGTLEMDAGATIAGPVSGAGTLALAGGNATLGDGASIATGRLCIDGGTLLTASGATATVSSDISGSAGTLLIAGGGNLTLGGAVGPSETIAFGGPGATLTVTDLNGFAPAAITGFGPEDALLVADSSTNVLSHLDALETLALSGVLTAISFTDAGMPALSLSATQLSTDLDALAKIVSPYVLASGITWAADQSGAFDSPAAWTGGHMPDAGSDAVIDFAGQPTVTYAGGSHTLHSLTNSAGHFVLAGGTLQLGRFDNESSLAWNGGNIDLDGSDGDRSGLVNAGGAVMSIAANGQHIGGIGGVGNAGALLVNGTGSVALDTPLTNTGTLVVTQGTLLLNDGGSSSGGILARADAVLAFNGGDFAVTGGYSGIATAIGGGTLDLSVTGGDFRTLLLSAGGLALGSAAADSNGVLRQSGGTLGGSGTFVAYAGAQISGGLQAGPGTTRLLGASSLGGLALDGGRVLRNDGALNWASGDILLGGGDTAAATHGGTLDNAGVLRINADAPIGVGSGGDGVVDNAGVIAVDAGAGTTTIDAALVNHGVVTVVGGTLTLGGSVSGSGILQIGSGAVLDFAGVVGGGKSLRFLGGGGTLALEQTGLFALPVAGFAAGGLLDLTALDFAAGPSLGFAGGRLSVSDGTHSAMLALTGSFAPSGFQLMGDGHGGVLVGYS